MLVNIRGTNGSGKSHLVRRLLALDPAPHRVMDGRGGLEAYELDLTVGRTFVLGSYHNATGGCDGIQPYNRVLGLLDRYSPQGHVVFEGILMSTCYGIIGRYLERPDAVMVFLTTPLEQCISNVGARRATRAGTSGSLIPDDVIVAPALDPKLLIAKYETIGKLKERVRAAGKVRTVELAADDVNGLLKLLDGNASA